MKTGRVKIIWAALAGLGAVMLAWSGYLVWWRGSLEVRPAEVVWPAAETVIDLRNAGLRVPAPFEPVSLRAEAVWPDGYSLFFEEENFDGRDQARLEMDKRVRNLRERYDRSSRTGLVTVHPLGRRLERPAVLVVDHAAPRSGREMLNLYIYILWDQSCLIIHHSDSVEPADKSGSGENPGQKKTRPEQPTENFLREREQFLERADEYLKKLGRGDFQGRAGGLEALSRLAGKDGVPMGLNLYSARFRLPGNSPGQQSFFLWSSDLEIRRSISLYRHQRRDYMSELLFPWFQPNGLREESRPLAVGGRPGREIIVFESRPPGGNWRFIWEEDSPPASREDFWQIYFSTSDPDRVPETLGLWRQMLERVRF